MLTIVHYPHPALRKTAQAVDPNDPQVQAFAQQLLKTLVPQPKEPLGVGLAANQVNKLWRLFIVQMPNNQYEIVINPRILKSSKKTLSSLPENSRFLEGCLSIPNFYGFVNRPIKIKVSYQTLTGLNQQKILTPPHSSYFQHELDHLNGVLFLDHLKKNQEQLYQIKKGKLNPVELI